jgi:glycosyltransferase involved in cell wall biosynthesis
MYDFKQVHPHARPGTNVSPWMNILVHDYAGHPAPVELSRELARRGHRVTHAYFAADPGPKGQLQRAENDAEGLHFLPLGGDITYSKTNFIRRRSGDIAYGRALASHIRTTCPDIVISGNTPTESQERIVAACSDADVPFIYWCQDYYSIAASRLLATKLPGPGHLIGGYYRFLERRQMRRATKVVHITDAFCDQTDCWRIARDKVSVIPNWGAIDKISVLARSNSWAAAQGMTAETRYLYSGTLALKHNPALLAALANSLPDTQEVVLVSSGAGAETLLAAVASGEVKNMRVLPLQPFDLFDEVLASGDILLAVIEREAGTFSVPSKILSYLCAGRPIVLAAPKDNLAAKILLETGAGKVVPPEDIESFVSAARAYAQFPETAVAAGKAGRAYAEKAFVLAPIADRFEQLFRAARRQTQNVQSLPGHRKHMRSD